MNFYSPHLNVTLVDVDRDSMLPILSGYRGPSPRTSGALNEYFRIPAPDQGAQPSPNNATYAYGELLYLLRRMPLSPGWNSAIPLVSPDRSRFTLTASVTGTEDVVVPAGTFKCQRVRISPQPQSAAPRYSSVGIDRRGSAAGETLWYATDGARPLVRIETGGARGELTSLRTAEQSGTTSYRDPQVGYSFTVPSGWIFHPRASFNPPGTTVDLFDPGSQVWVIISGKSRQTGRDGIDAELQAGAAQRLRSSKRGANDYTLRGPMQNGRIGGHQSLAWTANYVENGHKRVEHLIWIQSEATRASIAVQVDAADFDRFRERFQPILNSFRMP
jgi:hypothetical protein